eukprot:TRINITY_DN11020_c0_g2_i1.p1 TRINITY_DN11020_c0_g2~~TRINITY_DN11020_c0_g2_i1.p1  ORF type:complete len:520 (+),score=144.88 TRINITY_DN11020_c0_g2_i1:97-1656(+)
MQEAEAEDAGAPMNRLCTPPPLPELKKPPSEDDRRRRGLSYTAVLPMCLCEFLSFSILRAVLPRLQSSTFGGMSYAVEGLTLAVQGTLSFLCCPFFGALSDRYGRKMPLAVCAVGMTLPSMVAIVSGSMWHYQAFVALSGAFKATFVVVFAYVADTVPTGPRRTSAYGIVLGTLGASMTVGPAIGGAVAARFGHNAAFALCASLGLSAAAYATCILPESNPAAQRFNWHRGGALELRGASPLRVVAGVCSDRYLSQLMLIAFLYYLSYWGLVPSMMLYVTRRFNFTPAEGGRLLGIVGSCNVTAEVLGVRVLLRAGCSERTLLRLGLAGWALKCFCFALARDPWLLYGGAALSLVTGLFGPSLTSIASAAGGQRGCQGEVQGAVSAFRALAEGAGPLLTGALLVRFESSALPGAPYFFVGCVSASALLVSLRLPAQDPLHVTSPASVPWSPAVVESDGPAGSVRRIAKHGGRHRRDHSPTSAESSSSLGDGEAPFAPGRGTAPGWSPRGRGERDRPGAV